MKRWVFNIASALLLLLYFAIGFMWSRSYSCKDTLAGYYRWGCFVKITSESGGIYVAHVAPVYYNSLPYHVPNDRYRWWGFEFYRKAPQEIHPSETVAGFLWIGFPYWFLLLLTLPGPLILASRWKRHRYRHRLGLCPTCGYDLRASRDRCPECGSPIIKNSLEETPQ